MKRSALWAVVAAAGLVGLGTGCTTAGIQQSERITFENPLYARPERPLADVPVPVGFRYKNVGSYIFTGNYRVARLQYRGTPHIEECVAYLREQMPQSRWVPVRDSGGDERTLTFHNDCEELEVFLSRSAGITSMQIDIKPRRA